MFDVFVAERRDHCEREVRRKTVSRSIRPMTDRLRTFCIVLCAAFVAGLSVPAFGEGTFELRQGSASTDEVFLEGSLATGNVNYDQHRVTFLRVDVFDPANEVIDFYGEALAGSPDVQVWCPGGLPLPTPDAPYTAPTPDFTANFSSVAGALATFADVIDVQSLPRSINPVTYPLTGARSTCGEPGVYTVRFSSAGIDTSGQEFFDIRVRNSLTDSLESGRVWADKYAMSMGRSTGRLGAELYVVAGEDRGSDYLGVLWLLDLNEIAPFGFQLYANTRGVGPVQYNYSSIGGSASPPPELDPQFPIYLNSPAKPVVPPGLVGTIDAFEPSCTLNASNDVIIRFETQGNPFYTIRVDENSDGVFALDEVIETGNSISGTNIVVWDGVLPSGASIVPGNSYAIELTLSTGEVHFPFYDVEDADPGPVITPVSIAPSATTDLYFWDDTDPSITSGAGGGTTSGPLGSLSTHNWANGTLDYNDENMIDTWKLASVQRVDEVFVLPVECTASLTIAKTQTGGPNPATAGNDVLGYTVVVENTGTVSQTNVTVSDTLPDGSAGTLVGPAESLTTDGVLDVGETWTYTISYTVTQADIDAGNDLVNTVSVSTAEVPGAAEDTATTPVTQNPALTLVKTGTLNDGGDGQADAGDTITYAFTVTNTGNVTLTDIVVSDPQATVAGGPIASLAPGASDASTYTASYALTQGDIDAGTFTNTATAVSEEGASDTGSDTQTFGSNPALTLTKTQIGGPDTVTGVGDVIDYRIVLENTGNLTQTGVSTTDQLPDGSIGTLGGPIESLTTDGVLDVGETWTYTISYTVTQADIDAGDELVNTASVTTIEVPGPTEDTATTPVQPPAISVSKTSNPPTDSLVVAGQTITYTLTASVSEAALTADLVLEDTLDAGLTFGSVTNAAGFTSEVGGAPVLTFTLPSGTVAGNYSVEYTAAVDDDATDSVGNSGVITTDGGDPDPECTICATEHPIDQPVDPLGDPEVSVIKSSDPVSDSAVFAGQTITYTLTAEVTGAPLTTELELQDTFGMDLVFGSVTNVGAFETNTAGNPLVFTLQPATVPGSYSIEYTMTVGSDASGTVGNNVAVTGGGGDPDPECPSCSTDHPVDEQPPRSEAIPVPLDNRFGLVLLAMMLMLAGISAGRRSFLRDC